MNLDQTERPDWPSQFAKIIGCAKCNNVMDANLLRDKQENIPQPGYIGANYENTRLVLVAQNPANPNDLALLDREYTAALRDLYQQPDIRKLQILNLILEKFMPQWPLFRRNYFPLSECRLNLTDIAYFNLVRCRTKNNSTPNVRISDTCQRTHFEPWLVKLKPACIVFIGIWAAKKASMIADKRQIPYATINRDRKLSNEAREINRAQVAQFVRQYIRSDM